MDTNQTHPYNAAKLFRELWAAGIPVVSCSSMGSVLLDEGATKDDYAIVQAVLASHVPESPEDRASLVDRDTGQAINAKVHPFVPIEEQIGVLRAQIVYTLNSLGIEATPEFAALNELCVKEIEAAQERKVSDAKD